MQENRFYHEPSTSAPKGRGLEPAARDQLTHVNTISSLDAMGTNRRLEIARGNLIAWVVRSAALAAVVLVLAELQRYAVIYP